MLVDLEVDSPIRVYQAYHLKWHLSCNVRRDMRSHTSILKETKSFVFAAVQVPKLESKKEKKTIYIQTAWAHSLVSTKLSTFSKTRRRSLDSLEGGWIKCVMTMEAPVDHCGRRSTGLPPPFLPRAGATHHHIASLKLIASRRRLLQSSQLTPCRPPLWALAHDEKIFPTPWKCSKLLTNFIVLQQVLQQVCSPCERSLMWRFLAAAMVYAGFQQAETLRKWSPVGREKSQRSWRWTMRSRSRLPESSDVLLESLW